MARWDDPVQHYRLSLVAPLDSPARLFLCVGCRMQVVLCSRCDRGNRYCSRACWRQKHDLARRDAASRYQRSGGGRVRHAARSRRWRERIALRAVQRGTDDAAGAVGLGAEYKVTHQGSLPGVFITAAQLLGELASLDSDSALRRRLRHYAAPDLLMIDEVGYLSYSNRHADLLFELISRRYQHKSTVVTTNKPFAEWGEVFPNAACVVSLIDRLMHRAEVVRIEGKSYRQKEADEREAARKVERAARKTALRSRKAAA